MTSTTTESRQQPRRNSVRWMSFAAAVFVFSMVARHPACAVTFQEGVASYADTADTFLSSGADNTNFGADVELIIDTASPAARQTLIRFDNIFGNGAGQIPVGSIINSATLTLTTTDAGREANPLHRMLAAWDENAITYNNAKLAGNTSTGLQTDNLEASSTVSATIDLTGALGAKVTTVTADVQAWANNPASNFGWAIFSQGTNEGRLHSSESATISARPLLTVNYTVPEPSTFVLVSLGLLSLAFYGWRRR